MAKQLYLNGTQAALKLGVSGQRVRFLCTRRRIKGARKIGRDWWIPVPITIKRGGRGGRPKRPDPRL